ncbi:MAG: hypothetical protein IIZ74_09080 [Erysipelotrichaceae bacterium]|nr:hypothetical protein [Erysipelotrichaceae bacterium]
MQTSTYFINGEVSDYKDLHYPDLKRSAYGKELYKFYLYSLLNIRDYHPGFQVMQIPFNDKKEDHYINTATVSLLNYAHSHGIAGQYWTINTREDAEYLLSIHADAIITDYPDMVYELRNRK